MRYLTIALPLSNQKPFILRFFAFLMNLLRNIMGVKPDASKGNGNVETDPPPKAAQVSVTVRPRGTGEEDLSLCVTEIVITAEEALNSGNFDFAVTLMFSTFNYTIPSDVDPIFSGKHATYIVSGVAFTFPSTPPTTVDLKLVDATQQDLQDNIPFGYTQIGGC